MLLRDFEQAAEDGLLRRTVSDDGNFVLFKYNEECYYEKKWNNVTRAARGIIFDLRSKQLVAKPFTKFFNLEEVEETKFENLPWSSTFEVTSKEDGSLGICYFAEGEWRMATPGSFNSIQAKRGRELLSRYAIQKLHENCTYLFEIVCPESRQVVSYEDEKLILLAIFNRDSGSEINPKDVRDFANQHNFPTPKVYKFSSGEELIKYNFPSNFEGFVIRFENGQRVKIKSPEYVKLHTLLGYRSIRGAIEVLRDNIKIPCEIQAQFDDLLGMIKSVKLRIEIDVADYLSRVPDGDRKTKALWVKGNVPKDLQGAIFCGMDRKSYDIWRLVDDYCKSKKDC